MTSSSTTLTPVQADYVLPLLASGSSVIATSQQGSVVVHDTNSELSHSFEVGPIWCIASHHDVLATGGKDGAIAVWNLSDGSHLYNLNGHNGDVKDLSFVSSSLLSSGSEDGTLRVWDLTSQSLRYTLHGHEAGVLHLAQSDGRVISGSLDTTARLWDINTGSLKHVLRGHSAYVGMSGFGRLADGGLVVATGASGGEVRIWDVESGSCLATVNAHHKIPTYLLPLHGNLLSAGADGTVSLIRWEDGSVISSHRLHNDAIRGIVLYKDLIVTGSTDGTVKVWKNGNFDAPLCKLIESSFVVWQLASVNDKLVVAHRRMETEQVTVEAWNLEEMATSISA